MSRRKAKKKRTENSMGQDLELVVAKLLDRIENGLPDQDLSFRVTQHEGEIRNLKDSLTDFQKSVSRSFETSNKAMVQLGSDLHEKLDVVNKATAEKLDKIEDQLSKESQARVNAKVVPPSLYIGIILLIFAIVGGATEYVRMMVNPVGDTLTKVEQRVDDLEDLVHELHVKVTDVSARVGNP